MLQFLLGASAMGSVAAGLFFLRFWKQTSDRLFLLFALSFWLLALTWIGLVVTDTPTESRHLIYLARLLAFLLIIAGIWDKNRAKKT